MTYQDHITRRALLALIKNRSITLAGNATAKIFGRLDCTSGKRMKSINRVFFENREMAEKEGYRPCGHCMKADYKIWKYAAFSK